MPKNPRPGGIFGEYDFGWKGTTLNERIQAQNQWDLLEAQEKANEIAEERLKLEKEYYENIKQEKEAERKARLETAREYTCSKVGINYYNIKRFMEKANILYEPELEKEVENLKAFLNYGGVENIKSTAILLYCVLALGVFFLIPLFAALTSDTTNTIIYTILSIVAYILGVKLLTKLRIKAKLISFGVNSLEEAQEKLDNCKKQEKEIRDKKLKEFYNFRCNHYNQEIEQALQDIYLGIKPVKYEDIKHETYSVEEFNKFILSKGS